MATHRFVGLFSKERRNRIRGALSQSQKNGLTEDVIEKIRDNVSESDMFAAGKLLESHGGLKGRVISGQSQKDLWYTYSLPDKNLPQELAYVCGFLNSWPNSAINAIETIKLLALSSSVPLEDATGAVKAAAIEWGASNYLCYKIAFLKSRSKSEDGTEPLLDEVDRILGHHESPSLQLSAVENITTSISLFSVARRHTNTLRSKVGSNFRRSHNLNNLLATPISNKDAAAFLNRAAQTSFFDAVHAIWVLSNLSARFPSVRRILDDHLEGQILEALRNAQTEISNLDTPDVLNGESFGGHDHIDTSLQLYRKSAAFVEFPELCKFGNDLDRVIGVRLLSSLSPVAPGGWHAEGFDTISTLKQSNEKFALKDHNAECVKVDGFYRTYLFLRFIQSPVNLSLLDDGDFKYIFNNTSELDVLLLEKELETMHLNASDTTRPLVSVLALALYRGRSSDPDIDFNYRLKLESYIIENFNGNIASFITSLTTECPQIANYLAASLNETTLQKMYHLVKSPKEASFIRRDILLAIGFALNRIEYIVEAEAIETRSKVSKLKKYFDSSRMFVDSVAMTDWLRASPSAYTQEYKEILPKLTTRLSGLAKVPDHSTGTIKEIPVVKVTSTLDHLIEKIAFEAFEEFCTNSEFGIESYLGRRIRHNTLEGVTTDSIDSVLSNPIFIPVITRTRFGTAISYWKTYYKNYVDRIRKEFLQFEGPTKPNALLNPHLDPKDPSTQRGLSQLSQTLKLSGPEMLPDLIVAFCWQQIGPQLDYASRQIKVKMAGDVKQSLEQELGGFEGQEEQRIFAELSDAIDTVFSKIASWFRLPETGFVPATIDGLCNIIDIELGREERPTIVSGNALQTEYYGISVHRLYDCLAVLINNAVKHGVFLSPVKVHAETVNISEANLHRLTVTVLSTIDDDEIENSMSRIQAALTSTETGRDMVTEGYSGLKKGKIHH